MVPFQQKLRAVSLERLYVWTVIVTGALTLLESIRTVYSVPPDTRWLVLAILTVISGQLMLRMPAFPVSFSVSDVFTVTTALLFGPAAGAITVGIDAAVISSRLARGTRTATRYLFNVAAASLAMWLSATAFFWGSGAAPLAADSSAIVQHLGALGLFAATYFVLNSWLVALAIGLNNGQSPWHVWRHHFMALWPGAVGGASAAGLGLSLMSAHDGDIRVLGLLIPIPFILYVTFKTAVGRMHDQVGHLTRVNAMYLATIETLAQAVDARDEVTHDHIRRVQKNAKLLAQELGIRNGLELQALEAAALLHDIGKLAIPEHILNKPDRLTTTEFEAMKQHSTRGAEILSPIDFPFPVVPIVRHHHENWDGSGYPDGLGGEAIPIGARIISVVDCFDALLSDRPYRRAMSLDRAVAVIQERSGTMYDPRIVAAFLRIRTSLAIAPDTEGRSAASENAPHPRLAGEAVRQADPVTTAALVRLAAAWGCAMGRHASIEAACEELQEQWSRLAPDLTIVVYQYDAERDALFGRVACGPHREVAAGFTIGVGLRLTGWVAAQRKTIINSEAALDLGNIVATLSPPPELCLSTPIVHEGQIAGVLTVYSTGTRSFSANDIVLFDMIAGLLGSRLIDDAQPMTHAVVNGRERSLALVSRRPDNPSVTTRGARASRSLTGSPKTR